MVYSSLKARSWDRVLTPGVSIAQEDRPKSSIYSVRSTSCPTVDCHDHRSHQAPASVRRVRLGYSDQKDRGSALDGIGLGNLLVYTADNGLVGEY